MRQESCPEVEHADFLPLRPLASTFVASTSPSVAGLIVFGVFRALLFVDRAGRVSSLLFLTGKRGGPAASNDRVRGFLCPIRPPPRRERCNRNSLDDWRSSFRRRLRSAFPSSSVAPKALKTNEPTATL